MAGHSRARGTSPIGSIALDSACGVLAGRCRLRLQPLDGFQSFNRQDLGADMICSPEGSPLPAAGW